ncbi:olfactory receptor 11A1-like [Girardinichthys multiradiatus]|uniref:olfactory receptor 11A1-like n=1 Tax=Girardinichthys multiradiatus TaxID=208333 RepID=UPI001FABC6B1|nr:olfactory receptor 11A1-like [Girardinichthys multiradiatus]
MNVSQVSYFTLSAYFYIGLFKYVVFLFLMCVYFFIISSNVLLITVICVNRSLHKPMYMFLCSLFVNELYGSLGLFPFLLVQILSDVHTVSVPLCFLQIFCLYMYVNVEFYNLAIMSYDRYLAICYPLHYNKQMQRNTVIKLAVLTWFLPLLNIIVMISLNASSRLCGNIIDRVFCINYYVTKLVCSSATASNIYGLVYTFTVPFSLTALIVYTYVRILKVCFSGSKQTRQKAVSTCTPHLASVLNFSFGCFFEILQSRFDMSRVPNVLRIILSLYFVTSQPLFNPVMYGLKLRKICLACKALLFSQK